METGLLITVKKMAKVDSTYPVKITPELSDKVWGLDPTSNKNTLFPIPGILGLNSDPIDPTAINVKRYPGVLGDGINDDTVGLQLALDEAAGRWVHFPPGDYFITDPLVLPENTRIIGYGARVFNHESHFYLCELNSNTIIRGLKITGAGSTPFDDGGRAISCVGTVESYKENIFIDDCFIEDIGFYGMYFQFVRNLKVLRSKVFDVGYAGIMHLSCENVNTDWNWIKNIDYVEGGYGISYTRETIVDTLEANPRSKNCSATNNLVENVLQWKGLDTHGGDNISFINNTVLNCLQGIGIVSSGNTAPINCRVISNYLLSERGKLALAGDGYGVVVAGVVSGDLSTSVDFARNNQVIGNTIIGMGKEGTANGGSIRFRNSENTVISNNIVDRPLVNGILIQNTNYNFSVTNNAVEDPNSAATLTIGIQVQSEYNHGIISNNVLRRKNAALATNVGERGINVSTATNNKLIIKANENNMTLPLNVPVSRDIDLDARFNEPITINNESSDSNIQAFLNEGFLIYADNDGGQNVSDPVALWLAGRAGTTVYFSPRSGGPFHWLGINASTVDISGGILRLANAASLQPTGSTLNISGLANSGNAFKSGIHYTVISAGLANNYPENTGLSFVIKAENSRILEYFANTTGTLWYRSLTTGADNVWHKVITDDFITTAYEQTTDPLVAGRIWNNAGVLTFSNG
jgi:hypothetical protein